MHRNQCQQSFGDWLAAILEFSRVLHTMELDLSAFACLCALTLVNGKYYAVFGRQFYLKSTVKSRFFLIVGHPQISPKNRDYIQNRDLLLVANGKRKFALIHCFVLNFKIFNIYAFYI